MHEIARMGTADVFALAIVAGVIGVVLAVMVALLVRHFWRR